MKRIELNIDGEETTFNMSESWNEVTVDQASKLFAIDRTTKNELELVVTIVSILSKVDEDILYMMTQEQFLELSSLISFTNEEVVSDMAEVIVIDDTEYFLKKDFEVLTLGEIISIETIMKQSQNNLGESMSKLLCIFLRKKKANGKLESFKNDFMERETIFNQAIITDVNNIFLFFSDGSNLSKNNMKDYLENQK